MKSFDVVVIGVSALEATLLQLEQVNLAKVALVEMSKLGGVCLNKGCIPTKAVLKSAHSVHELQDFKSMGIDVELKGLDGSQAVKRAKGISDRISKGVGFLMKKTTSLSLKVMLVLSQQPKLKQNPPRDTQKLLSAANIIVATGATIELFQGLSMTMIA